MSVTYERDIVARFREYRVAIFKSQDDLFDRPNDDMGVRPPVFRKDTADYNVLVHPEATPTERKALLAQLPVKRRHRWFRSMKSSQALVQSVFGNLIVHQKLHLLSDLTDDSGQPLFSGPSGEINDCRVESAVGLDLLGEKVPTEIDVYFPGSYRIAVECKFAEAKVGDCSIPRAGKCSGSYKLRADSGERCYLTEQGIKYWEYVPEVFDWDSASDISPCPLKQPYQLVRNILAACVRGGQVAAGSGHAVLLYDERNPAFKPAGDGFKAWEVCQTHLRVPGLLRRCTWQKLSGVLQRDPDLHWLTDALWEKYGIH